jgi:hypothetical protein
MSRVFIGTDQAAAMLSKPTRKAFRMWAKRRRLTVIKDGRRWLVDRLEIEAELKRKETVA